MPAEAIGAAFAQALTDDPVSDVKSDPVPVGKKQGTVFAIPKDAVAVSFELVRAGLDVVNVNERVGLMMDISYDAGAHWWSTDPGHDLTDHWTNGTDLQPCYKDEAKTDKHLVSGACRTLRFVGSPDRMVRLIIDSPEAFTFDWKFTAHSIQKAKE